jgi:hypothetical protein
MLTIRSVLLITAFIALILAAVNVNTGGRVNLLALGLALWVLAILLPAV